MERVPVAPYGLIYTALRGKKGKKIISDVTRDILEQNLLAFLPAELKVITFPDLNLTALVIFFF